METNINWGAAIFRCMNPESFCAYFAFAGQRDRRDCQSMVAGGMKVRHGPCLGVLMVMAGVHCVPGCGRLARDRLLQPIVSRFCVMGDRLYVYAWVRVF
jgi:hypothetical protein